MPLDPVTDAKTNARKSLIIHAEHVQSLRHKREAIIAERTALVKEVHKLGDALEETIVRIEQAEASLRERALLYREAGLVSDRDARVYGGLT